MKLSTGLAHHTLAWSWSVTGLAGILLIFQVVIRHKQRSFGVYDALTMVAWGIGVIMVIQTTWAIVDEGQGEHQQNLSTSKVNRAAKSLLITEALWTVTNGLLRTIACLVFWAIFRPTLCLILRSLCIQLLILSCIHATVSVIQIFLICRPFAAQWDPHILGACGGQAVSFITLETTGLVLDIGILLLPVQPIYMLQMRRSQKWQVILVIDASVVLLSITALRMRALYLAVSPDFTYSQSHLSLLSTLAVMLGISICSAPSIFAFLSPKKVNRNVHERIYRSNFPERERYFIDDSVESYNAPSKLELPSHRPLRITFNEAYKLRNPSAVSLPEPPEPGITPAHLRPGSMRSFV